MKKYSIILRKERENKSNETEFRIECQNFKEAYKRAVSQVKRHKMIGYKCRIILIFEI